MERITPRLLKFYITDHITSEKMKVKTLNYKGNMPATAEVLYNPQSVRGGTEYDIKRIELNERIPDEVKKGWELLPRYELVMECL